MTIRLAIVSKSRLFCEGIARLIEDDPEITIIGIPGKVTTVEDLTALEATWC